MVVERKRVDRLETKEPAHTKVSPFRPTIEKKGANEFPTHKIRILHIVFVIRGLSKPTGNVASNEIIIGDFNYVNLIFKIFLI
jgi:hypothetical protein